MYFLISCTIFAALVTAFLFVLKQSNRNPALFARDSAAMTAAIFFTSAFAGAFGAMIATVDSIAGNLFVGIAIAVASAAVIIAAAAGLSRSRARAAVQSMTR